MRNDHGRRVHRKVKSNGYLPYDWSTFLRYSELFQCLSKKLIKDIDLDKCSVVTVNDTILKKSANRSHWFGAMENWRDSRTNISLSKKRSSIKYQNADSDAVVIAVVSVCHQISNFHELWVKFRKGKDLKYIVVQRIVLTSE